MPKGSTAWPPDWFFEAVGEEFARRMEPLPTPRPYLDFEASRHYYDSWECVAMGLHRARGLKPARDVA